MSASSTALQKKNTAPPSARRTRKSPIVAASTACGPRTRSSKRSVSGPGIAKRSAALRPAAIARRARRVVEPAAGARIARRLAGRELRLARDLELGGRAEARVRVALALEALVEARVHAAALRLAVGTAAVVAARARVEVEAQPCEVRELRGDERLAAALAVGVLDAHDEAPAARGAQTGS